MLAGALHALKPFTGLQGMLPLLYNALTLGHAIATFVMFIVNYMYTAVYTYVLHNEQDSPVKQRKAAGLTTLVLCGILYCTHLMLLESNVGPVYELSLNMTSYLVVYVCKTVNAAVFQKKHRSAVSSFALTVVLVVAITFFLLNDMRSFTFVKDADMQLENLRSFNFDRTVLPDTDKSKYFRYTNDTVARECSQEYKIEYWIEPGSVLNSIVSSFMNTSTVVETTEETCTTIPIERADSEHVVSTVEEFSPMTFLQWFVTMPWHIKAEETEVQYQMLFHAMCNAIYIVLALPITTCINVLAYIGTRLWKQKDEADEGDSEKTREMVERKDWLLVIIQLHEDPEHREVTRMAMEFMEKFRNELDSEDVWTHTTYMLFLFKRACMHARYYASVNIMSLTYGCLRNIEVHTYEEHLNRIFGVIYHKVVHDAAYMSDTSATEKPLDYFDMGFKDFNPEQKKILAKQLVEITGVIMAHIEPLVPNPRRQALAPNQA
jgi:hypothetical protein